MCLFRSRAERAKAVFPRRSVGGTAFVSCDRLEAPPKILGKGKLILLESIMKVRS
jgi:hypothetical protein